MTVKMQTKQWCLKKKYIIITIVIKTTPNIIIIITTTTGKNQEKLNLKHCSQAPAKDITICPPPLQKPNKLANTSPVPQRNGIKWAKAKSTVRADYTQKRWRGLLLLDERIFG